MNIFRIFNELSFRKPKKTQWPRPVSLDVEFAQSQSRQLSSEFRQSLQHIDSALVALHAYKEFFEAHSNLEALIADPGNFNVEIEYRCAVNRLRSALNGCRAVRGESPIDWGQVDQKLEQQAALERAKNMDCPHGIPYRFPCELCAQDVPPLPYDADTGPVKPEVKTREATCALCGQPPHQGSCYKRTTCPTCGKSENALCSSAFHASPTDTSVPGIEATYRPTPTSWGGSGHLQP